MLNITQLLTSNCQRTEIESPIVVWNLTSACNLDCKFCYYDAKKDSSASGIDWKLAKRIIKELKVKFVLLSGGEPLLYPNIFDLIEELTSNSIRVGISTNGTLIDRKLAVKLKKIGVGYVGISLDGLEKPHNYLRNSSSAFSRALAGLKNIQEAGLKSGIRLILNSHNYPQLKDFFILVENLKPDRLCFYHLIFAGRARQPDYDLTLNERRKAVELIIRLAQDWIKRKIPTQVLTVDNFSDAVILLNYVQKHRPATYLSIFETLKKQGGCPLGKGILSIDHRGNFHPCQFWHAKTILPATWKSMLKGRCAVCAYKDICGGCRVRAYQAYGDYLQEDPSCEIDIMEHNQRMRPRLPALLS